MDLPWHGPYGIVNGEVSERTLAFLERYGERFDALFISWQPAHKGSPRPSDVFEPWDTLFARIPHAQPCLHQTVLNLAGANYDRSAAIALTNELIERYGFDWVNEDLGHWSYRGRNLPYPRAARLTEASVGYLAGVCREVDDALLAPLVVEFPGYEQFVEGMDAYDGFRQVIERSGCACNLDTGHLLTWRWAAGYRGKALLDGLERLPLDHCVELHCAGVVHTERSLLDAHHGVLADLQLELTRRLTERCPNLRRVTYEDPRFNSKGELPRPALASLSGLERVVEDWLAMPGTPGDLPVRSPTEVVGPPTGWEQELADDFAAPGDEGARLRGQILDRSTRGVGTMRDHYAEYLQGDVDELLRAFVTSSEGEAWSDLAWAVPGRALEDALGRFLARGSHAHNLVCVRLLAVHPNPPFTLPDGFARSPTGWVAVGGTPEQPHLYAARGGDVLTGPITPLLANLLSGEVVPEAGAARQQLVAMGLL